VLQSRRDDSIRGSKKRPQQDSNLRTRLRRAMLRTPVTSQNACRDSKSGSAEGAAWALQRKCALVASFRDALRWLDPWSSQERSAVARDRRDRA
jgi:hypothetical protein